MLVLVSVIANSFVLVRPTLRIEEAASGYGR